jgi:branched-chain amino acid transport system permease protein
MALPQVILNGLITGSIYALIACGFSLIYSTNKFIHFAHGISVVIASYILFLLFAQFSLPLSLSIILTIVLSSLVGLLMYRLIYHPLQKRKASNIILLLASFAILILGQNLLQIIFGVNIKTIPLDYSTYSFLGLNITLVQIITVITSLIILLLLFFFMKKTKLGRNIRAVADNEELASIIGINPRKIADLTFIIGSGIAGIAGILVALEFSISATMGTNLIIKGFTGAIVGGIASVPASIIGSYILGIIENLGVFYISSSYKDAISFIILFLFLLLKPEGIFGHKK